MTGAEQTRLFNEMHARMKAIRESKNKDYANDTDSLANFRLCEQAGIPAWVGIWMRLGDKYARVTEQVRKYLAGEEISFAVAGEGMTDTCEDGGNYFLLLAIAFQDWRESMAQPKRALNWREQWIAEHPVDSPDTGTRVS